MKGAKEMTDDELGEAILELAAPRARMAPLEDLRKIADTLATLAVEAAGRIKERAGPHPGEMLGKLRNVSIHADGRLTADLEIDAGGDAFVAQITGRRR